MALGMVAWTANAQEETTEQESIEAASEGSEGEGVDALEVISHHISDSHHWNVFSWKGADGEVKSIDIPLPVIAYNKGDVLITFSSSFDGGEKVDKDGYVYSLSEHDKLLVNGEEMKLSEGQVDLSLTRNVASMLMSVALLLLIFVGAARSIAKTKVPRGAASVAETLVLFVKDIADEQIGKERGERFAPFLLTLFFFIWINNIIGLVPFFPGSSNLSGNISFTAILAVFTFCVTHIFATKAYWIHTVTVPGVPAVMKLIMVPLEIVTMFTRPFTLLIRLFANITGGHIIIISLFSLIFLLHTYTVACISIPLALMVFVLELIFGALQAYIFTVLSALYIGLAVNAGHEE